MTSAQKVAVVVIDAWPASSRTSRNEPPALWTKRAARVMKVRRPECEEQPCRPIAPGGHPKRRA